MVLAQYSATENRQGLRIQRVDNLRTKLENYPPPRIRLQVVHHMALAILHSVPKLYLPRVLNIPETQII